MYVDGKQKIVRKSDMDILNKYSYILLINFAPSAVLKDASRIFVLSKNHLY